MFGLTPLRRNYAAAVRDLALTKPEVRAWAANDLGLVGDTSPREAADALAPLLNDRDTHVRSAALTALATLGARHLVDVIAACCEDADSNVRQVATMALAEVGGERALAHLRRALTHQYPEVRFQALLGVMEMDPHEGLDAAVSALDSEDPWIASEAAVQVGELLGPASAKAGVPPREPPLVIDGETRARAVSALVRLLDSVNDRVVVAAAIALGRARDPRAVPTLSHFVLGRRTVAGDDAGDLLADAIAALGFAPEEVSGEARAVLDTMASRILPTVRRKLARDALAALDAQRGAGGLAVSTPLIDSHCHLDFADFADPDGSREAVLARGRAEGIAWFVTIGSGRGTGSAPDAVGLSEKHPDVVATVGIHPHDAVMATPEALDALEALAKRPRVVAIGEVGLDYHYNHSPRDAQRDALRRFVAMARRLALPLVIHTRSAPDDTLAILREENARDVGGVIHCFTEDGTFARGALDMGFDISLSGVVTFKKSDDLRAVARTVPLDRLLIETDSPYLAPVPHRGRTNEPAYLSATARHLAGTLGLPEQELRARTTENAMRRFGLHRFALGVTAEILQGSPA